MITSEFRKAFIISVIGHCLLFIPRWDANFLFNEKRPVSQPEISYIPEPTIIKATNKLITTAKSNKSSSIKKFAKDKVDKLKSKVNDGERLKTVLLKKFPQHKYKKEKNTNHKKTASLDGGVKKVDSKDNSIPGTTLPNTPECIDYYHSIRAKIKERLDSNYNDYYGEGNVFVIFTILSNGYLENVNIVKSKSTNDLELFDIALNSIQEASPFAPFPENLTKKEILFNVNIIFKKK